MYSEFMRRFLDGLESDEERSLALSVDAAKLACKASDRPFERWLEVILDFRNAVLMAHECGIPVANHLRVFGWEVGATADFISGVEQQTT